MGDWWWYAGAAAIIVAPAYLALVFYACSRALIRGQYDEAMELADAAMSHAKGRRK